jgi:hypothetical protein
MIILRVLPLSMSPLNQSYKNIDGIEIDREKDEELWIKHDATTCAEIVQSWVKDVYQLDIENPHYFLGAGTDNASTMVCCVRSRLSMVSFGCCAHAVNLLVGDLFSELPTLANVCNVSDSALDEQPDRGMKSRRKMSMLRF